jgi:hypothetical protein
MAVFEAMPDEPIEAKACAESFLLRPIGALTVIAREARVLVSMSKHNAR